MNACSAESHVVELYPASEVITIDVRKKEICLVEITRGLSVRWQRRDLKPVVVDRFDHTAEGFQIVGFADGAIGVQLIGARNVLGRRRCGHYEHGYLLETMVVLYLGEYFQPMFLWQVEIEYHEVGPWPVAILAELFQVIDRRNAIGDDVQINIDTKIGDDFFHEHDIRGVVLNEEHSERFLSF